LPEIVISGLSADTTDTFKRNLGNTSIYFMIIIYKIELTREQFYITYHVLGHAQGRRHGFENGGDNFASGASKKNF